MSLVIVSPSNTELWMKAIGKLDPKLPVEVYPDVKEPEKVRAALTWAHPHGSLGNFPNLEWICSIGAGVDHILGDKTLDPSIPITRIVDRNLSRDMKRAATLAVLHWENRTSKYREDQSKSIWDPMKKRNVSNIGIIGLGEMGKSIAGGLVEMGYTVSGFSRSQKELTGIETFHGEEIPHSFLQPLDVLICILPNTPESRGIINENVLTSIQDGGYFVNVGRGSHLDESALEKTISSGKIGGAWLDVFNEEPLPSSHNFWKVPEITIMPHIASKTDPFTASEVVVENYHRLVQGKHLLYKVDRERGY